MALSPWHQVSETFRARLVGQVRDVFNDRADARPPAPPSDDALFERDSPIRMVHADLVGMMVGGVRGLLLQMLHPAALQGVLDHSDFRSDMHGRLRRTASFIAVTTFGHRDRAMAAIGRVNAIHDRVSGTLPDGAPYSARDPRTLAYVHVVEALSFLGAYRRFVRPDMPFAQQDRYFAQFAVVARALGADPVPETLLQAEDLFREFRSELQARDATREVARLVLSQRPEGAPLAVQRAVGTEAVAMLPPFARRMLRLDEPPALLALPARAATWGMGKTLRWAFRQ
jgi:uncharacterized protein (DUF2236 family)